MTEIFQQQSAMAGLSLLPASLRQQVLALLPDACGEIEELRLRLGKPLSYVTAGREECPGSFSGRPITDKDLGWVLETAGHGSIHAVLDQLRQGFLPVEGGHRIGICGSAVMKEGQIHNFRNISSLAIRLGREMPDIGAPLLPQLIEENRLCSTLIFSPPGCGKTTLLRDLIRCISDGVGVHPLRVSVADERGEVCGMVLGSPQWQVGSRTDVIDGCPKAKAMLMLLRGMNPQVLATDEITARADIEAMEEATGCGVALLATAHGGAPREILLRPIYRQMIASGLFERFVWISLHEGRRQYRVLRREEMMQG